MAFHLVAISCWILAFSSSLGLGGESRKFRGLPAAQVLETLNHRTSAEGTIARWGYFPEGCWWGNYFRYFSIRQVRFAEVPPPSHEWSHPVVAVLVQRRLTQTTPPRSGCIGTVKLLVSILPGGELMSNQRTM